MSHGFATETNESEIELQVKEATECSTLFRGLSKIKVREQQDGSPHFVAQLTVRDRLRSKSKCARPKRRDQFLAAGSTALSTVISTPQHQRLRSQLSPHWQSRQPPRRMPATASAAARTATATDTAGGATTLGCGRSHGRPTSTTDQAATNDGAARGEGHHTHCRSGARRRAGAGCWSRRWRCRNPATSR